MAHSNVPQAEADQRQQGDDGLREVTPEKARQTIVHRVENQRDVGVGAQVPEQPGVVMLADGRGFPQFGIGDHGDRPRPVRQLHHVRGLGAVGPGLGEIFRVFQMKRGVETGVGRGVLVFQVEFGQIRVRIIASSAGGSLRSLLRDWCNCTRSSNRSCALSGLLVPQRFGHKYQAPTGACPVQHLIDLARGHARTFAE